MSPSNLGIKSYTQPSCTLQVVDQSSPMSNWGSRQTQFELHFDRLEQPEEKISIGGDRHQLAQLHEVVTNYVQNLLVTLPDRFNTLMSSPTNIATPVLPSNSLDSDSTIDHGSEFINNTTDSQQTGEISLQPESGLSHNLFLGTLANFQSGQVIKLTTLQLFDLATALDEYALDVLTTPSAFSPTRPAAATPSNTWASIAAMLLLGVGITAAVVQILNYSDQQPQTAQRNVTPRSNNNQQPIALKPTPTPQLLSPDALPSLPPGSTSNPTLSPPSGIPSNIAPGTILPVPQTTPGIPSPPPVPTTQTTPITSVGKITQAPPNPKLTGQQESISIPKAITPEISTVTTLPGINTANIPSPQTQKISPPTSSSSPLLDKTPSTPIAKSNSQPTAQQRLKAALQGQGSDSSGLPNRPPTASEPKTTALVTTPQSAEVKDYFTKNWEPPSNLTQTLEYSIVLDVDGSIQRIEPLGKAARTYVDRSGMPLIGEPFVSPSQGDTPRIRVVLSPDGNVKTFVEPN